jgi:(4-(4-[2-(gamma-L-glutamylamino)ethyl]phenoxymethyl)furan-2-yl)methanamine synthase
MVTWLAFDIGGANLKTADGDGHASSRYFPLWKESHNLADALRTMIAEVPRADHIAVTMTGELADCFRTKAEGVTKILQAVDEATDRCHTRVYRNDGKLVSPQVALRNPQMIAAANWLALATFAGGYVKRGSGLLIDIGSTTTDLVPLIDGVPAPRARTDTERLIAGELVYTGIERSPICAITKALPYRGQQCPTAQEYFATTWDAYLTLGDLPEVPGNAHTADGRAATKAFALERLARAICADRDQFDEGDANLAAEAIQEAQLELLTVAASEVIKRMPGAPATVVVSGRGEFLARKLLARLNLAAQVISLSHELGPAVSRCATAHALAVLAREATR